MTSAGERAYNGGSGVQGKSSQWGSGNRGEGAVNMTGICV